VGYSPSPDTLGASRYGSGIESAASAAPRPLDRKAIALFAVPMAALTVLAWVGDALAPTLLNRAPLLLLVCNARLRNLVLVSPMVDFMPFVVVAVGRLVISDPLFYWFGRRYGDVSIRWMERKLGPGAGAVLWTEKAFRKAAWPVVALMPNNIICLLAGATGMAWAGFAIVNVIGTFVRVLCIRLIGDAFSDPILSFNAWIGRNRLLLTVITIAITFVLVARGARRGREPIETPDALADELEAAARETDTTEDPPAS
jgi:membrane protein DedA with SNARE-associated domain